LYFPNLCASAPLRETLLLLPSFQKSRTRSVWLQVYSESGRRLRNETSNSTPYETNTISRRTTVKRIDLAEDIKPVSQFRARAAEFLQHVGQTRRPLVLTQRGRSVAVLLDVSEYERLLEELEILRDLRTAQEQLDAGLGVEHDAARARILEGLSR